ncbi:MAG: hypothetical protein ACRET4_14700, partial [Steroidobacteraceae bacterium]
MLQLEHDTHARRELDGLRLCLKSAQPEHRKQRKTPDSKGRNFPIHDIPLSVDETCVECALPAGDYT